MPPASPPLHPPQRALRAVKLSLPALLLGLLLVCQAFLGARSAWAGAASAPSRAEPSDARAWLARIHRAANSGNYEGTLVFSADGTMSSSRVAHYAVGTQTYERLEALDGRQRRIVRHNNVVHTLWPQSRTAVVEQRETLAAWSATPQSVDPVLLEQYSLQNEGSARIAGRDAVVVLLQPRDHLRYAQRLWADRETGLMLRADVLAPAPASSADAPTSAMRGAPVLESTAFSEVLIGVKPRPEGLMQAVHEVDASAQPGKAGDSEDVRIASGSAPVWHIVRPHQAHTTLAAEGWFIEHPVPGFSLAGCVRRGMHAAATEEPVVQAVFTDGLTHVSVFVEPFNPSRHGQPMQGRHGATGSTMGRRGDDWITIVGDVPMPTLVRFSDALARRRP